MEKICRTCLRSPGNLLPLFDDTGLPQKIETICSVQVADTDNLPRKVCAECVININLSYNFRRIIINSDTELKRRVLTTSDETKNNFEQSETSHIKVEIDKDEVPKSQISGDIEATKSQVNEDNCNNIVNREQKSENIGIRRSIKPSHIRHNLRWRIQTQLTIKRKIYKCKICNFATAEYTKYHNHRKKHIVTKSVCNICGKYIRSDNLKKHITTHMDAPVACKECGKVFKNNESLRSHLLMHKGLEVTCEYCGQTFKYRGGYHRHVRKQHSLGPTKKVKCTLCEKTFFENTDLKKHMRSHTGERPYPCEYCKKGFSSSYALKTHVRQHTNEKPYACEHCPMAFPQKVSLRTHLKSKHSIEMNNS